MERRNLEKKIILQEDIVALRSVQEGSAATKSDQAHRWLGGLGRALGEAAKALQTIQHELGWDRERFEGAWRKCQEVHGNLQGYREEGLSSPVSVIWMRQKRNKNKGRVLVQQEFWFRLYFQVHIMLWKPGIKKIVGSRSFIFGRLGHWCSGWVEEILI